MANITPHIEMTVKLIYSFKSMIYWGGGKIQPYSKALDSAPGMFTSLKEIQAYIQECEQKRLDLDYEEVCSNKIGGIKRAINGLWTTAELVKKQSLYLCHRRV